MHSLVAATSDTVRIWDLGITSTKQSASSTYQPTTFQRGHRSTLSAGGTSTNAHESGVDIATDNAYVGDKVTNAIDNITTVSWAADGNTFVVGGHGTSIRQYARTGEALQDIPHSHRTQHASVAAVQHYGPSSQSMFVANNTARKVQRYDFVHDKYTATCQTHENDISCLRVCAKKRLVVSATAQGGEIAVFNLLHNTRTDLRSSTHKTLTCVDIAQAHRSHVAVGSEDGVVQLFDAARAGGAPVRAVSLVHTAPVRGIAFHPASHSAVLTAGLDKRVVVTDTSAYAGSGRGAAGALEIRAHAPLTCLSCTREPFTIGVGTIDGDVLVYDARMAGDPVWSASVRRNHAVVCMDLVQSNNAQAAPAASLARSTSQREARGGVRHASRAGGYGSSDDIPGGSSLQSERRRVRGSVAAADDMRELDEKPPSNAPPLAARRADHIHRPPQHPNISRFRPAPPKPAKSEHMSLHSSSHGGADADDADDMESTDNFAKDRSFMEMMSPVKPDRTLATANPSLSAPKQPDILSQLSKLSKKRPLSTHSDASPAEHEMQRYTGRDVVAGPGKYADKGRDSVPADAPALDADGSPVPRPWNSRANRHAQPQVLPQTHDAGDSMMEMFTPERETRPHAPVHNVAGASSEADRGSPRKITKPLLSQLQSLQSAARPEGDVVKSDVARASLPAPIEAERRPEHSTARAHTQDRTRVQDREPPARATRADPKRATPRTTPPATTITPPATTNPSPTAPQPTATDGPHTSGLGSISSSVLQNAVADALAPLCEQLRGEIRNLHLDVIRQGFVYQEQIRTLREECAETRMLRQEMEALRRENAQLRMYVPFFDLPSPAVDGDAVLK
ncbi:hypothetical protein GGF43_003942 [Coemansia sp. RSA 2618]|nr:hypothetical protein GGF43_003942 [Coemansia sp. RSA 2618]